MNAEVAMSEQPVLRSGPGSEPTPLRRIASALQLAEANGGDMPTLANLRKAIDLLAALPVGEPEIDIYIADDGTIELTAFPPRGRVTVDVHAVDGRIEVLAQDGEGATIAAIPNATESEAVTWFGNAA